ncbi:chemotaxis-specific protein-glutamate methyltransferase CheB [Qipengyuania sp. ASV99]|uniref:chemotaxis-specific protein-glutamate methyltransferase CheB n=1 Tax=Qipengyuania sp. ASV99 TaxID=3399681 RepID=UPI003A4C63FF
MNARVPSASRLLKGADPLTDGQSDWSVKVRPADAIRVMLIDDSLTVRTIFKRMVESDGAMVVAETASSAERGIAQLQRADVDVILLDLEMPGMGGLEALPAILAAAPNAQVMVVSSLTEDGAEASVQALSTGAADTMLKPRPGGFTEEYRSQMLAKIRALGSHEALAERSDAAAASSALAPATAPIGGNPDQPLSTRSQRRTKHPDVLAIGASTGGIHALNVMLRALTPEFDLPILITQHLPSSFIPVFARQIEVASGRPTHIAEDGTEIRKGEIAIATGHGHMIARRIGDRLVTGISAIPAPSGCLPSVSPMLSSLAVACEGRALAVILSGMGRDGVEGAEDLVAAGGSVWAQDAESSAVWGMPGAVAKAGLTSLIASPDALGMAIMAQFAAFSRDPANMPA